MSDIRTPQNPGIGGLDELTLSEEIAIQQIAAIGDPGVDYILGYDTTDNSFEAFLIGSGLTYTHATHTLSASGGGGGSTYTVTTVTGASHNETATSGEVIILCNATSNAITVNLPTAVANTATITIKKTDSSSNTVTIDGNSTETIDGGTTAIILIQYASVTLISDNSNWRIV